MKVFIVQCLHHSPGYEVFRAKDFDEAAKEMLTWPDCHIVLKSLEIYNPYFQQKYINEFKERRHVVPV